VSRQYTVLISCLWATSVFEQGRLIAKLLREHGANVEMRKYISIFDIMNHSADAYLWLLVINPTWLTDVVPAYIEAKQATGGKAYIYSTVEGIPYPHITKVHCCRYAEYVANSNFTKRCLEKAGLKVIDVIHHAVDFTEVEQAKKIAQYLRQKIKRDFPGRVVFCYVGRDDHRKQLDKLMQAIDIVNEKAKDKLVLLLHTELRRPKLFERPNVYIVSKFGELTHVKVLALMHASDYFVFPSVCEGFGVPVLEAMAVGRPVIHCWFEPLSEFSNREYNIVFDYLDVEYWKTSAEQYFEMHMYEPEQLADAILYAIDIYTNYKSEYEERCTKLTEWAKKWNYRNIYSKWLHKLGVAKHE